MVAWPGEKLDLWDAGVAAGGQSAFSLWSKLRAPETPDTSVTLVAGDDIWVWSLWTDLLNDTDPIGTCNWIVEGDSGDVEFYTGHDPDFSGDQPTDWVLSSSTVQTGRTIISLPEPDRTFDWLFGNLGGLALRIRVLSGSVALSQVRLQVEPPGGLLMRTGWHWSDFATPAESVLQSDFGTGIAGAGSNVAGVLDKDAALDAARSGSGNASPGLAPPGTASNTYTFTEFDGDVFTGSPDAVSYDRATELPTIPPSSAAELDIGYASGKWKERPDYRTVPAAFFTGELQPGRDYEKIGPGGDWPDYVEFAVGDTDAIAWVPVGVAVTRESGDSGLGIGITISFATSQLLSPTTGWSGTFSGWPPPVGSGGVHFGDADAAGATTTFGTPSPGSDWTVVNMGDQSQIGFYPAAGDYSIFRPHHHWHAQVTSQIRYLMPDYRYHVPTFEPDPDAIGVPYPDPRFWVKDWDGEWVPVGFGIPETEIRVFKTWTPLGMYRDLTKAEYVTVLQSGEPPARGLPLRVKRDDNTWDLVAWLVPD